LGREPDDRIVITLSQTDRLIRSAWPASDYDTQDEDNDVPGGLDQHS